MGKKLGRLFTTELFISFFYRFNRIYSWTFRLKVENEKEWMDYLKNGGTVLLCTWHQQFFSAIRHFQNYKVFNPSIMISQSKDGEIVAGVAKRTGWHPVRGSSSKGGKRALRNMIDNFKKTKLASHIVDGPRGPSGKVKAGVIRLAHVANAVIVPFYVSAENGWHFNSWDEFLLPKPFSKVSLRFGKMIKFESVKDEDSFEKQRKQLEDIMLPALKV
ncbi:lysophospholipid acyltransferase family protein [Thermodesulfobacteriota bacterium]